MVIAVADNGHAHTVFPGLADREVHAATRQELADAVLAVENDEPTLAGRDRPMRSRFDAARGDLAEVLRNALDTMRMHSARVGADQRIREILRIGGRQRRLSENRRDQRHELLLTHVHRIVSLNRHVPHSSTQRHVDPAIRSTARSQCDACTERLAACYR